MTRKMILGVFVVVSALAGCGAEESALPTPAKHGKPEQARGFAELGERFSATDHRSATHEVELVDVAFYANGDFTYRTVVDGIKLDTVFEHDTNRAYAAIVVKRAGTDEGSMAGRLELRSYVDGVGEVWSEGQLLRDGSEGAVDLMPAALSRIDATSLVMMEFVAQHQGKIGWDAASRAMFLENAIKGGQLACRSYLSGTLSVLGDGALRLGAMRGC